MENQNQQNLDPQVLANLFQQEIPLVQNFLDLLEQEHQLLKNFRSDNQDLETLVSQKNELLSQIRDLENQRFKLLNLSDNPSSEFEIKSKQQNALIISATDNLISKIDVPEITTLWQILRELAKNVQDLNSKNGNLLGLHLNQTNEILKILQQQTDKPTLYGKRGRAYEDKSGRISDKA